MQWCPRGHQRFQIIGFTRRPKLTLSGCVEVQILLRIIYVVFDLTGFPTPCQVKAKNYFVPFTWRSHADLPPVDRTKSDCLHTVCNSFMSVAQKHPTVRFHDIFLFALLRSASSAYRCLHQKGIERSGYVLFFNIQKIFKPRLLLVEYYHAFW